MSAQLESEARAMFPYATVNGHDHLAWAKRIHYRDERGDKELTSLQVRFAKTALGLDEKPKS